MVRYVFSVLCMFAIFVTTAFPAAAISSDEEEKVERQESVYLNLDTLENEDKPEAGGSGNGNRRRFLDEDDLNEWQAFLRGLNYQLPGTNRRFEIMTYGSFMHDRRERIVYENTRALLRQEDVEGVLGSFNLEQRLLEEDRLTSSPEAYVSRTPSPSLLPSGPASPDVIYETEDEEDPFMFPMERARNNAERVMESRMRLDPPPTRTRPCPIRRVQPVNLMPTVAAPVTPVPSTSADPAPTTSTAMAPTTSTASAPSTAVALAAPCSRGRIEDRVRHLRRQMFEREAMTGRRGSRRAVQALNSTR